MRFLSKMRPIARVRLVVRAPTQIHVTFREFPKKAQSVNRCSTFSALPDLTQIVVASMQDAQV